MERRDDIERLTRLETKTEALVKNHEAMDEKLDTIMSGITELKTARQIESDNRKIGAIRKGIAEGARIIAAALAGGASGSAMAGKAQAVVEQVTPHVR